MGLMIDQGLIPRLLNLIRMEKYNPSALWTLDNVLYNNETGEARKIVVCIAHEGGAVKTLTDILCAGITLVNDSYPPMEHLVRL